MHLQSSLVLSLPALALAAYPGHPGEYAGNATESVHNGAPSGHPHPTGYHNSTAYEQEQKHIAGLQSQVEALREQLASKLQEPTEVCSNPSAIPTTFTVCDAEGAPTATHTAAYVSFFSSAGSISRLEPTTTFSYASEASSAASSYIGNIPGASYAAQASSAISSYIAGASSSVVAPVGGSSNAPYPYSQSSRSNGTSSQAPTGTASSGYGSSSVASSSVVAPIGTGASSSVVVPVGTGSSSIISSSVSVPAGTGSVSSSISASAAPSINSTTSAISSSSASSTSSSTSTSSTKVASTYLPALSDFTEAEVASGAAWKNVSDVAVERQSILQSNGTCTYENARVRTEFRNLSPADRKSFTDAIACLQKTAPRYVAAGSAAYPGVKTRYDEFVATHINMTFHIHGTADFLAWHRNFIWEFETDLAEVCGYAGNLPYWNWAEDAFAVDKSEIFNGDEYSMGGNGEYVGGRSDTYLGLQNVNFPPGTGGGCVYSGPFSNATYNTNLGPIDSPYNNNVASQYDLNPRCLVRDLNTWFSSRYNTYTNLTDLVLGETSVQYFQALMQGGLGDNNFGVHGGGHWLGGGPSQLEDFHSSPNDPVFFIHHAMIDRVWSVWQYLDIEQRQNEIAGTSTLDNSPASPVMSLSDSLDFGLVGGNQVFGDLMSTYEGRFCYRYD